LQALVLPFFNYTFALEELGLCEKSIAVWSATKGQWVNSVAVTNTGCEGGNFISSTFLADHLDMLSHTQDDLNEHHIKRVDIQGKTDSNLSGR
jgi:hypothetical protein